MSSWYKGIIGGPGGVQCNLHDLTEINCVAFSGFLFLYFYFCTNTLFFFFFLEEKMKGEVGLFQWHWVYVDALTGDTEANVPLVVVANSVNLYS